jgi:CPA1 family monovalent cation:H+ antiporter
LRFTLLTEARHGRPSTKPSWRLVAATSIAGVRGAVTLAGVLTLPLTLNDGSPFPTRDLAILLAAGAIIVSLIGASVGLAPLLKGLELPPEPSHREEEDRARIMAAEAAIKAIVQAQHDLAQGHRNAELCAAAGARMMQIYRQRIERESKTGEEAERVRDIENVERELRLAGIRAERDTLFQLEREQMLPEETARSLVRDLDLLETRYAAT